VLTLIVFDLDGTLVNSRRDLADATNELIVDLGGTPLAEEAIGGLVGDGAGVLVRRALGAAGLNAETPGALERFLKHYDARLLATTRPYPGMVDALETIGGSRRLAVLTNKPASATARVLDGLDLARHFTDVVAGDSPLGRKPKPAGLQELMTRAGARPDATLMVGDSSMDLLTARNAGTRVCLARYGFGYRIPPGDLRGDELIIDAPAELPRVIEAPGL
jgi:phosphoglycolate phosphatase